MQEQRLERLSRVKEKAQIIIHTQKSVPNTYSTLNTNEHTKCYELYAMKSHSYNIQSVMYM